MRKFQKIFVALMALLMALSMAACGAANKPDVSSPNGNESQNTETSQPAESAPPAEESEASSVVDATYTVTYDNSMETAILDAVPSYQFNASNLSYMITYGLNLSISLDIDADGSYTLTSKWYNPDTSLQSGDPAYCDVHVEATGTYTLAGDKVTISAAESASSSVEAGSYYGDMFNVFSFAEDGSAGEWISADVPEILACVPATVFTVTEDGTISTWEAVDPPNAGNPHDVDAGGEG